MSFLVLDLELGRDERFHAMAARRDGEDRLWKGRFEQARRRFSRSLRRRQVYEYLKSIDPPAAEKLFSRIYE